MSLEKDFDQKEGGANPTPGPGVEIVIEPRLHDLGGFSVGRVLPSVKRRMVGPFSFFDEIGPAEFTPGTGVDVRPHPHIGLATVTYLFDGEIRHRDNLGFDQVIRPGDVNWMTAGSGVVHSERTDDEQRAAGQRLHGIQSWIALPESDAEADPAFHHHPKAELPLIELDGARMRLIAGAAFGQTSPVRTFSRMFYLALEASTDAVIELPASYDERALYVVDGMIEINGVEFGPQKMVVFEKGAAPAIKAVSPSRIMLLGGDALGPRRVWWNFVAVSQERIDRAKQDWRNAANQHFQSGPFTLPPGEDEFIPLPEM